MDSAERDSLLGAISRLRDDQLELIEAQVRALVSPVSISLDANSDLIDEELAVHLGDVLKLHHVLSNEPFTKDKFEFALVAAAQRSGHVAEMAPRGNPGWDVTIDGARISLKTQADRNIKRDAIHISKFMELGKGRWEDENDLAGLRDRMFAHMEGYDRIVTLRCLQRDASNRHFEYEMVEIPKDLLLRANDAPLVMNHASRQNPKPGRCAVVDENGALLFELYFDGGTERKLQVQKVAKSACTVHASWEFALT